MDEFFHHNLMNVFFLDFRENFEKMVQKIMISRNCLQFPEIIPENFRENFTEKTTISVDLQQNFEKVCEHYQNVRKSESFDI